MSPLDEFRDPPSRADGGRAAPERRWTLCRELSVATRDPLVAGALDAVFGQLADRGTEPESARCLPLTLEPLPTGPLRLCASGLPIVSVRSARELAPALEAALVGFVVRIRDDAAAFHASAVELDGVSVVFPGPKGSGKSTLALTLALEYGRAIGDEVVFVEYGTGQVAPFPKHPCIKAGAFAAFEETMTYEDPSRGPVRYFAPPAAASVEARLEIGLFVFPTWSEGQEAARIAELGPEEVALELVEQSFGGLERDPRLLELICRLARRPAFRIRYSEAEVAAAWVQRLAGARRRVALG